MNNIFISYRRKDAATEAYLLYKDLINDGYSVFFDHKSLGEGNFRSKIQEHIRAADSFIVLLSASSFGNQIMNVEDVYRYEIKLALEYRKRIIGIMLEDFTGFPDDLPEDIAAIRNMNCLKLHIGYYEAMYGKLISGSFLPPHRNSRCRHRQMLQSRHLFQRNCSNCQSCPPNNECSTHNYCFKS